MDLKKERAQSTSEFCSVTSKGLLLGFISGFIFSLTVFIVKYLKDIHPGQLTAYRYLAIWCAILPTLVKSHENPLGHPDYRLSVLIVAVSSTGTSFLMFLATKYLPLGEASALTSCNPVFITVAGRLFLKEALGLVQVVALLSTILGIVLITGVYQTLTATSRVYTTENLYGFAAALGALIVATVYMTLTRKLALNNIHYSVILFISGIVGVIQSAVLTALLGNFDFCNDHSEGGFIILLGVLSYFALLTLTVAAEYAKAGPVSTMRAAADILFSFVWQVVMFHDIPDEITIYGTILLFTAVVLVGFSEKINSILPGNCRNLF